MKAEALPVYLQHGYLWEMAVWNAIQWLHNFTGVKFMLGNSLYIFST